MSFEMPIKRGDIVYVEYAKNADIGSEQYSGRPAVVVSSQIGCDTSGVVQVVYLTTKMDKVLSVNARIHSSDREEIAICSQINTISKTRLAEITGHVSDDDMRSIEKAILIGLGIELGKTDSECEDEPDEDDSEDSVDSGDLLNNDYDVGVITGERDAYKEMVIMLLKNRT